jgi:hypothetical protein
VAISNKLYHPNNAHPRHRHLRIAATAFEDADGQHDDRGDGPGQLPDLRRELLPQPAQALRPIPV